MVVTALQAGIAAVAVAHGWALLAMVSGVFVGIGIATWVLTAGIGESDE